MLNPCRKFHHCVKKDPLSSTSLFDASPGMISGVSYRQWSFFKKHSLTEHNQKHSSCCCKLDMLHSCSNLFTPEGRVMSCPTYWFSSYQLRNQLHMRSVIRLSNTVPLVTKNIYICIITWLNSPCALHLPVFTFFFPTLDHLKRLQVKSVIWFGPA